MSPFGNQYREAFTSEMRRVLFSNELNLFALEKDRATHAELPD